MTTAAYPDVPSAVASRAPHADPARVPHDATDFDALLARTAERLRGAHHPMTPDAFDALVLDVVLDAIGFAQGWTR